MGSCCLLDIEFQFGKMKKCWRCVVRIVAQQCECILNLTELKMVTMIKFYVTYILPLKKKGTFLKGFGGKLNELVLV